jgi:hypothetical protein
MFSEFLHGKNFMINVSFWAGKSVFLSVKSVFQLMKSPLLSIEKLKN